jgi:hypothetical protein
MFGGEASQMRAGSTFLLSSAALALFAGSGEDDPHPSSSPSRATAGLNHTWRLGRYTVVGGVMPYLKTSRVPVTDGVKKGSSRTTPVRMPPPVKIPPSTPVPAQTNSAR